jgi:hypothetical protein
LDWHFGSVGDFTSHLITSGVCEANPPFTPGLIQAMVDRIEFCLSQADRLGKSLTFVVVVPTVPNDVTHAACAKRMAAPGFQRMTGSASCRLHIILGARQHGYIAGAQHLKTKRYKYSLFETSVILLQSEAARKQPLPDQLEERIRESFQSLHLTEATPKSKEKEKASGEKEHNSVGKDNHEEEKNSDGSNSVDDDEEEEEEESGTDDSSTSDSE